MQKQKKGLWILIVVASLGYFVDIYDLILYNIVKMDSLNALNIPISKEKLLFQWQMAGMLLGGIGWGILGDKRGRVSVLFGSILLYSIANIANAFVHTLEEYMLWRFIAGFGLAGELGAAITLVSENMHKDKRGYGTMIIVTFGALGAVAAYFVASKGEAIGLYFSKIIGIQLANWQVSYIVGGILGLLLLILRSGTFESSMYANTKTEKVKMGTFSLIFKRRESIKKYFACIAIGVPVWFVIGILIALSHTLIKQPNGSNWEPSFTGEMVLWSYVGLSVGDLLSGLLSQWLKSRKKVIILYLVAVAICSAIFLFNLKGSAIYFKSMAFLLGAATGYWALFVTNASEQFGTNIRSTVSATVPNMVRGTVILIYAGYGYLQKVTFFTLNAQLAAIIIGVICLSIAFWGVFQLKESFNKDLNYLET